jgi:hypothetical protein
MSIKFDLSAKAAAMAAVFLLITGCAVTASGQSVKVLEPAQAKPLVPSSFKFQGQSAQTQVRNSSVADFGRKRRVMVGLVDTSGYSTDVASEYEGFFITDLTVKVGGVRLGKGSYGFGFSGDGWVKFQSVDGKRIVSVRTKKDTGLKRPRPLMLLIVNGELRFYKGRTYAVVSAD